MTPDTPRDPTLQKIQLSRGEASYTDEGEGPVLVAIHGLPGSVRDYRWLGASLPSSVRLIRVDMPGFGQTPKTSGPGVTIEARGNFVAEFLDAMDIKQCVILGHSMGGPIAMEVASRHPARIQGLALLSSVGLRTHRLMRRQPSPRWISRIYRIPGVPRLFKKQMQQGYYKAGFPTSTPYEAMLHSIHIVGAIDFSRIQDNQQRLQVPTFLSWAEDDRLIEAEIFQELAAICPEGPRLSFADGGHNIQKTHAVELGEALANWLQQLNSTD